MAHYLEGKSPEERQRLLDKAQATRRRNKAERERLHQEDLDRLNPLKVKLQELEDKIAAMDRIVLLSEIAKGLTGKTLLREEEVVQSSQLYTNRCGVYFLINLGKVVYVGQSTSVFARVSTHFVDPSKQFTHFAWCEVDKHLLDKFESLYIHVLRPQFNGEHSNGLKQAPLKLSDLLS